MRKNLNKKVQVKPKIKPETEFEGKSTLVLSISDLANKGKGASIQYSLDTPVDFNDPDIHPKSNLTCKVEIMKIENEYNVAVKNLVLIVERICDKCLKKFKYKIEIPYAEAQYLITDEAFENRFDFFYADIKNKEIDISEFLRQEIILHFPLVAVCSPHCKGINYV